MILKPSRQALHSIAVAHPDIQEADTFLAGVILNALEQPRMAMRLDLRVAEFTMTRRHDAASEAGRHGLHAVADAQHRHRESRYTASGGAGGVPSVTDSGPPDRMMPRGAKARTASSPASQAKISQ